MEMTLLVLILAVQTIAVVVLAVTARRATRKLEQSTQRLDRFLEETAPKVTEVLDGMGDFVKAIRPVGEQLVDISLNLKEVFQTTRDTTEDIADFLRGTTATARQQVSKIDNVLTDTVRKMELVTTSITDNLLNPLAEISAVVKGVRAAVMYLRGDRRRKEVHQAIADEEMFI
jgi:ABC-type transporter Mla subunit MlaD